MNLTSSYGPANLQFVSAPHSRPRYHRVCLVPEERDDGSLSEELSHAVAAVENGDDILAGHIKVRVTVQNTCPIADCRSKNYVRFMIIVSLEDAPTRLSEITTAYFICDRRDCHITFELEEDSGNRYDDSSHVPCPLCNNPFKTSFLFSKKFWKRFTRQPCGCKHERGEPNVGHSLSGPSRTRHRLKLFAIVVTAISPLSLRKIRRTAMMIPHIFFVRYATALWRRALCSACFRRGSHVDNRVVVNMKEENLASDTIRLDRLLLDID